ncbi:hypothetical protein [Marinifilum sp.]|uniref:hypothetical protein n=1 Tax=Marinifilum sp. TaxID=2033137 RepID=UPI003BAC3EE9
MKLNILIAGLILIGHPLLAQESKTTSHNLYIGLSNALGNFYGGDISLDYIHNNKLSFHFTYHRFERKDPALPNDYSGGLVDLFTFGENYPNERLESIAFLGGMVFPYKGSKKGRWNLRAGFAYSKFRKPFDYKKVDSGVIGNLFVGNYNWQFSKAESMSLILKPELEIAFFRHFGIGIHTNLIYNKDAFIVGLGVCLKFGFVRGKLAN